MRRLAAEGRGRRAVTSQRRTSQPAQRAADRDVVADRLRGWWAQIMAGQTEHPHPVFGGAIRVHFDQDVLVVTGVLPHAEEVHLRTQLRKLSTGSGLRVRIDVKVKDAHHGGEGLLEQTIIGVFETRARAEFAHRLLADHPLVRPSSMTTVRSTDLKSAEARRLIPREYRAQARDALRAGDTLLVVTVDEVHAFRARELIDEETRSLMTLTLPPTPAS